MERQYVGLYRLKVSENKTTYKWLGNPFYKGWKRLVKHLPTIIKFPLI